MMADGLLHNSFAFCTNFNTSCSNRFLFSPSPPTINRLSCHELVHMQREPCQGRMQDPPRAESAQLHANALQRNQDRPGEGTLGGWFWQVQPEKDVGVLAGINSKL